MYTIQSLWTMARENLDVCVLIFSNRSYNILHSELADVGAANPGPRAIDMLTLDRPTSSSPLSPRAWACRPARRTISRS